MSYESNQKLQFMIRQSSCMYASFFHHPTPHWNRKLLFFFFFVNREAFERNTKYPENLPNNFCLTVLHSQQLQALVIFADSKWEQNSHLLMHWDQSNANWLAID